MPIIGESLRQKLTLTGKGDINMITREQARETINSRPELVINQLTQTKTKNKYICPFPDCRSGTGKNHTAAFSYDPARQKFRCFSCMERAADTLEMLERLENTDETRILEKYTDWTPAPTTAKNVKGYEPIAFDGVINAETPTLTQSETRAATAPEPVKDKPADYSSYYKQCNSRLTATDYHRGISLETLNRFCVGYDPSWRHPKAPKAVPTSPRLIIPTSPESYIARDTRPADKIPEQSKDYTKSKAGNVHIFNPAALATTENGAIFVVEGELDAMSIIDVGGAAVGMGSMSNGNLLLQAIKETRPTQPLIIALDNDEKPATADKAKAAATKLCADLKQEGVKAVVISDIWGKYKDPNEMLQGDRSKLQEIINEIERDPENWEKTKYINSYADARTNDFTSWIVSQGDKTPYIPTGFKELDGIINGGLYDEKLYAIGAISSLGKTTLVMQIADNIARAKRDVLIFSLEMGEFELYGKSISRITYELTQREGKDTRHAKTELGITLYENWSKYDKEDTDIVNRAIVEHRDRIGRNKKVVSSIGGYTVNDIQEAVQKHISFTGKTPVVIVDYLQILESTDPRLTDKQKMDHDITALKRLAVAYKLPIVVISSLNRQNYKTPISYEAFKESGAIEYSVDVLIGLQLHGVGQSDFNVDQAKQADPRKIELVLLKQRQGKTGLKIGYDYYPKFNYFEETGIIESGAYREDQTEGREQPDKAAFKAEWNYVQSQQLDNGFSTEWLLEQWGKLLAKLDRTTDLYISFRRRYDRELKKAEKEKPKQEKLTEGDKA